MHSDCTQKHRIDRLEKDVEDLQKAQRSQRGDISELKEGRAEQRAMLKQIFEMISEMKAMIRAREPHIKDEKWMDLVKYIIGGTIMVIVGWMASCVLGGQI